MKIRTKEMFTMIILTFGTVFGVSTLCTSGYSIVAEGKEIAFIDNLSNLESITKGIDRELCEDYGEYAEIGDKITVVEKIDLKHNVTSNAELIKNLSGLSEFMREGYVLIIDDEDSVIFSSYEKMLIALQKIKSKFVIDDCKTEFLEKIEYRKEYVTNAKISKIDNAVAFIEKNNLLNVRGVSNIKYRASLEYDTIEQQDNTMYIGNREVISDGIPGESVVSAEVEYLNGEEVSRLIIDERNIKKPVSEIVKVGTLPLPPGHGSGTFIKPVSGKLTSEFGERWGRLHSGIDIAVVEGTEICAADGGTVIFSGESSSYGLLIKIDHGNGYTTYYAHCSKLIANVGDVVKSSDVVALSGNTGNSTGPHCHFEIRYNNEPLDPLGFMSL